jgi:hypothetical protein
MAYGKSEIFEVPHRFGSESKWGFYKLQTGGGQRIAQEVFFK